MFTPPASATVASPHWMLSSARCSATNDDEQAVLTARLGPDNPKRYDTRFATDECKAVGANRILVEELVMAPHHAGEHAHLLPRERLGRVARVLERVPCALEEDALLRIHAPGFAARQSEERRSKPIDALDEPTPATVRLAKLASCRVVVLIVLPAIRRDLDDGIVAGGKVAPE